MADLDDIDQRLPDALFSMDAADNAELVPGDLPPGRDSLWSTAASPDDGVPHRPDATIGHNGASSSSSSFSAATSGDDEDAAWAQMGSPSPPDTGGVRPPLFSSHGFGLGHGVDPTGRVEVPPTPVGAPGAGGVFSADPVVHDDEVLDEVSVDGELEDDDWFDQSAPGPVFSSGSVGGEHDPRPSSPAGTTASPFAAPPDPWSAWQAPPPEPEPTRSGSEPPPFAADRPTAERRDGDPAAAIAADQHGLDVAVSRLRTEDQERARVPLSVCGALLAPGEQVLGAVTGQMLGRPAAVVVTRSRVLVVNDRRWQPIVDIYTIDERLQVRGRHDRHVAALSFADDERLSMVDGITEVETAIDLVTAIRDPGLTERGSGSAF